MPSGTSCGTLPAGTGSTVLLLGEIELQKRIGWEIAVRIEKILCTVLHESHTRQVEETMNTLSEGPEGLLRIGCFLPPRLKGGLQWEEILVRTAL